MQAYDTLHMLESLGYIKLATNGCATDAEEAENRWYLDQQDAEPEAYTADVVNEELGVVLTEKGKLYVQKLMEQSKV
jgi:hypothetical protein